MLLFLILLFEEEAVCSLTFEVFLRLVQLVDCSWRLRSLFVGQDGIFQLSIQELILEIIYFIFFLFFFGFGVLAVQHGLLVLGVARCPATCSFAVLAQVTLSIMNIDA